ncbi:UNVERIFIED_CONTAM: ornithine carbamoyltransferase [Siphonaria sp. JEL0065]|nr:ornithine carbamoyltransferase [Siphonaria sp. JEL0065]
MIASSFDKKDFLTSSTLSRGYLVPDSSFPRNTLGLLYAVFARLGDHSEIEELAKYSSVPVINALTAKYHPMQGLADIMTIYEAFLSQEEIEALVNTPKATMPILKDVNVAWVGDANNIINSLLVSLPRLGINVSVATPAGYNIDADIKEYVEVEAAKASAAGLPYGIVKYTTSPKEGVNNADIIVTGTWVSMGQESEKEARLQAFDGHIVTEAMAREGGAKPSWMFMHCLSRKLEEVDNEVFYNEERSLVFGEANHAFEVVSQDFLICNLPIAQSSNLPNSQAMSPTAAMSTSSIPAANFATKPTTQKPIMSSKHFLTLRQLSPEGILALVHRSLVFKYTKTQGLPTDARGLLSGKTLALLFTKKSTRTRISAETGWAAFGGHPMFLGSNDIQLGDPKKGGESWRDTSQVVGSMVDAIFARLGDHSEIEELAKYSRAPVINALTAKYHPMQGLADIMTIYEAFLSKEQLLAVVEQGPEALPMLQDVNVAWVGDANNIINSLLVSLPRLGINVAVATPVGYEIDEDICEYVEAEAAKAEMEGCVYGKVSYTNDPQVAVKDSHIIVTDTWVSMGQEAEKQARLDAFKGFQVTELMAKSGGANQDWKFMHCLPRKLEEVDDEVFYNQKRSLVFGEAENRKWTAMAVFECVGKM